MIKCPSCGRENKDKEQICLYCGSPLVDLVVKTRALERNDIEEEAMPKWGAARYTQQITLVIVLDDREERLTLDTSHLDELKIGRYDAKTKVTPQIDLTKFEGAEKGVSRLHGAILRKDNMLQLIDYNSANGTYLNGQKLVPEQPRIIRDGDDIRLGYLTMRVIFERE